MKKQKIERKIKKALKDLKRAIVRLERLEGGFIESECHKLGSLDERLHDLWSDIDTELFPRPEESRPSWPMLSEEAIKQMSSAFVDELCAAAEKLHGDDSHWPSEIEP